MTILVAKIATQLLLAAVFVIAGITKLRSRTKTIEMLIAFGVPVRMSAAGAMILPLTEISAGAGLLVPAVAWPAAAGATLLLAVFTIVVGINLALGRHLDCNCFGQTKSAPIGPATLLRNLALTCGAGLVLWARPAFPATGLGEHAEHAAWAILGLATLASIIAAAGTGVVRTFRSVRRRRRTLSASSILAAFAQRARFAVRPASTGLPVGTMAPAFELPTAAGFSVSLGKILLKRQPVLLIFVSPRCPACEILTLEAEAWTRELNHSLMLVLVHEGGAPRLRGSLRQLYQQQREVADLYRSWGDPEAVLINPDGTIGSAMLKGLPAIRAMIVEHMRGAPAAPEEKRFAVPREGLAIAAMPPIVTLTDQHGRDFTFESYRGREVLVVFWSATCSYCRVLLETLQIWERSPPPWAPVVLLLRTDINDPQAAPIGLELPVAFDKHKVLSDAFGLIGTPSGILLDAAGRVASELAGGVDAIMALANGVVPAKPAPASNV